MHTKAGHERVREGDITTYKVDRTLAIEEMVHSFERGRAQLPGTARELGGCKKDGLGDYYRQMMAPVR